jgi:dCMP deaminase
VPHTQQCLEARPSPSFCMGAGCTITSEDAPELFSVLSQQAERPSWDEYGLALADTVASRADCSRRKVGAVIMRPDRSIVATGYNGAPSKGGSCLKGDCPRGRASTEEVPGYDQPGASSYDIGAGSCIALHAEQNALLRASWDEMEGSILYVTCEPCGGCMRMILGTPLKAAIWPGGYRLLR